MTNFLFTTIRLSSGTNQRVAINTDFIVKISDIDLEQSHILLDDDTSEIAQECFESLTAKLPHRPVQMGISPAAMTIGNWTIKDFQHPPKPTDADRAAFSARLGPCPPRKIQNSKGCWNKNPAWDVWQAAKNAAKP